MTKAIFNIFVVFILNGCIDIKVKSGTEVKYNDPKLRPLFIAISQVNRDSMGFAPLDSNSRIIYKEEYEGTSIKLFFEKPDFLTILFFDKSNKGIIYQREEETTKGPRKMFVKDVDGFKTEIQETITRIYDSNKENLFGKNLIIKFLDIDKYPEKRPYNQDSSEHHPQVIYETEVSIEQAEEVLARWK